MPRLWKFVALFAAVATAACSSPTQPEAATMQIQRDSLAAENDTAAGPQCSGWMVVNGVVTCP